MVLTLGDLDLLKQLRGAGASGAQCSQIEYPSNPRSPREGRLLGWASGRSVLGPISDHTARPRRHSRARFVTVHRHFPPPCSGSNLFEPCESSDSALLVES